MRTIRKRSTRKKQQHTGKVGKVVIAAGILIMWWWVVTHVAQRELQGISALLILGSILGAVYFINHLFYQKAYRRR